MTSREKNHAIFDNTLEKQLTFEKKSAASKDVHELEKTHEIEKKNQGLEKFIIEKSSQK